MNKLNDFDVVIMLTFSDWHTEMNGNRYHYATRHSRLVPVYFIQINGFSSTPEYIKTEFECITVVKINSHLNHEAFCSVLEDLKNKSFKSPLFWVYNPYFSEVLQTLPSPKIVYHATEDYFCDDFINDRNLKNSTEKIIRQSFLTIAVTHGIKENILKRISGKEVIVSENGCDYKLWSTYQNSPKERSVVYQGGIHNKIDFNLLSEVIKINPDIPFYFYGEAYNTPVQWTEITKLPNVKYDGKLGLNDLLEKVSKSKIGIIPFVQNDWIVKRSFPLKFYEYLSAGMHVISTPINSLPDQYSNTSSNALEFSANIRRLIDKPVNLDEDKIRFFKESDYDSKFNKILDEINGSKKKNKKILGLIVIDAEACENQAVTQHIENIQQFSEINFKSIDVRKFSEMKQCQLPSYEVIVIHYSVRFFKSYVNSSFVQKMRRYQGVKVVFIQDEYDNILKVRKNLKSIAPQFIFTCVPTSYIFNLYPEDDFPKTRFISNLTGYISSELLQLAEENIETERPIDVFYRGRRLPISYGTLGFEKSYIGERFKEQAKGSDLVTDIEVDDSKRIYGSEWYEILKKSKTMLGTESGSNVFDFEASLPKDLLKWESQGLSYLEKIEKISSKYEQAIQMNQISPKIFEMFATGCVPILFEGKYSELILPHINYIPLKKDFSNFEDVTSIIHQKGKLDKIRSNNYIFLKHEKVLHQSKFIRDCLDWNLIQASNLAFDKNQSRLLFSPSFEELNFKQKIKRIVVLSVKRVIYAAGDLGIINSNKAYSRLKILFKAN